MRWVTIEIEGELLPTSDDIAEQQRQRAELAESQLRQVAVNLLQQGMTVEIAELTSLSVSQVEEFVKGG